MSVGHFQSKNARSFLFAGALTGLLGASIALASPPTLTPRKLAVTSESPTATRDAASVLQMGGSAADAAIVAALVAGVASPTSSGIGGGGFVVGWDAAKGEPYVLDFREVAPAGLVRSPFEAPEITGEEVAGTEVKTESHLIGVPGEVRGLYELHKRAGKLPWKTLVQKAADRANNGYPVGAHLGNMLAYAQKKLSAVPALSALYYPGGKPAPVGVWLKNPALGKTLEKIAQEGPTGFYEGSVAADVVSAAQAHGSSLTLKDLREYKARERTALRVRYAGQDVYTMPPPSAGGLMMVQVLKMFPPDYLERLGHGTPAYQHLLAEALRGAVADRMRYLSDPDVETIPLEEILADDRMEKRREKIVLDRTHSIPRFNLKEEGTHALLTGDRAGNVVSLTTTVNLLFGSKIVAETSGVVLNNQLGDFSTKKEVEPLNLADTPNRPRPFARPVSSMTPTLVVKDGQVTLALGGSGGTAIATNAVQTLLAALVFDHDPLKAVSADRIYIPTSGVHMRVEKGTKLAHIEDLERRGEIVAEMPFSGTAIQMLRFDERGPRAAADPRKHGLALAE